MSITILLSLIFGGLLAVAMAIVAVVLSRRQAEATVPRCGNCGYNLTGAPSNRCPECGKLFIEAGIVTRQLHRLPSRRVTRVLILVLIGFMGLAVLGTVTTMAMLHRAARARAVAAQQAAIQARMQAQLAAQRATTTAPATKGNSTDQPPEAP